MTNQIINRDEICERYQAAYTMFLKGEMTTAAWVAYCMGLLENIMVDNKDVFIRLRDR